MLIVKWRPQVVGSHQQVHEQCRGESATRNTQGHKLDESINAVVAAARALAAGAYQRKSVLEKIVSELKKCAEEIAQTLTMESGKPIKNVRGEATRTIDAFQVAAEESARIYGIPLDISARN